MKKIIAFTIALLIFSNIAQARELQYRPDPTPTAQSSSGLSTGQYVAISAAVVALSVWLWQTHKARRHVAISVSEWEGKV